MTFIPRLLIIEIIFETELYCRPSGNMVSAAPGQLRPAYKTCWPEAETISLPDVVKGVSGQAHFAGVDKYWGKLKAARPREDKENKEPRILFELIAKKRRRRFEK